MGELGTHAVAQPSAGAAIRGAAISNGGCDAGHIPAAHGSEGFPCLFSVSKKLDRANFFPVNTNI